MKFSTRLTVTCFEGKVIESTKNQINYKNNVVLLNQVQHNKDSIDLTTMCGFFNKSVKNEHIVSCCI